MIWYGLAVVILGSVLVEFLSCDLTVLVKRSYETRRRELGGASDLNDISVFDLSNQIKSSFTKVQTNLTRQLYCSTTRLKCYCVGEKA